MLRPIALLTCPVLACMQLYSQAVSPLASLNGAATAFGGGETQRLSYAGDKAPSDFILGQIGYEAGYDSNPLGIAGVSTADAEQAFSGSLQVQHDGEHVKSTIGYQPYYLMFLQHSNLNQFNERATADITLTVSHNWSVRARDDYSRQTDLYVPLTAGSIPPSLGSPNGLNGTIYAPASTEQANSGRADVLYHPNIRTVLDLFGGYDTSTYSEVSAASSLYDTKGPNAGASFTWRPSEHSIMGLLGVYQRLELSGTVPVGTAPWIEIASLLPTYGWNPKPNWQFQGYAGPQFSHQPSTAGADGTTLQSLTTPGLGAGITIAGEWTHTALLLSANHTLTNGGGLLTFVRSTVIDASLGRHLPGQWEARLGGSVARNRGIPGVNAQDSLTEMSATGALDRPLRGNILLHIGYDFVRQESGGNAPTAAQFDRNRIICGVSWRIGTFPLSH